MDSAAGWGLRWTFHDLFSELLHLTVFAFVCWWMDRGLPDTSFLLGFGNAVFWFGAYVCFACKGIVYARAEHLAFFLLGLIAFIAAASPLRHDRHTC